MSRDPGVPALWKKAMAVGLAVCLAALASSAVARPTNPSVAQRHMAHSLIVRIQKCMNPPTGAAAAGVTAVVQFTLSKGELVGAPIIVKQPTTALEQSLARAAVKAVLACAPYPKDMTDDVRAIFDARPAP